MSESIVQITDLHKSYGRALFQQRKEAVRDVSLTIHEAEVWAFIGPNGAGKTTTLHCMMGLLRPDAGKIEVFGQDPQIPAVRAKIGFQSEIFFTYANRTAEQVLRFYGKLSGLDVELLEGRISDLLRLVGLENARKQKTGSFSKGMLQRLGLAQSLLHDPELILWDEPSSGLDPEGRRMVKDLLMEMKARRKTILFSTHILSDIENLCDHFAIFHHGRVLQSGSIEKLGESHPGMSLEDVYLYYVRDKSSSANEENPHAS